MSPAKQNKTWNALELQAYIEKRSIPIPFDGCWLWLQALGSYGYGVGAFVSGGRHITTTAHRISYKAFNGEILAGLAVKHSCSNLWCVNPNHLVLGVDKDTADNNERTYSKLRNRDRIAWIGTLKQAPCTACHRSFPPECMDFDHKDGEHKVATVSQLISASKDRLLTEIAKCELVCANCHRTRTMLRRQLKEAAKKKDRLSAVLIVKPALSPCPKVQSIPHDRVQRSCWAYETAEEAYQAALATGRRWYARNGDQKRAKTKWRIANDPAFAEMKRASVAKNKKEALEFLWSLKDGPCSDCHERFRPECMDFDHLDPKTKLSDVAKMTGRKRQAVIEEISKCALVCANCHRKRTKRLKQGVTRTKKT